MTERQKEILDKIIKEYITSALPVSSQTLEQKYDFGVRPATIRRELQYLTEQGFLAQPHISAGRVPTDKGYRFFVDELPEHTPLSLAERRFSEQLTQIQNEEANFFCLIQGMTKLLSSFASSLVITSIKREHLFWEEGWEELVGEPEFEEITLWRNLTKMLRALERRIDRLAGPSDNRVKVYIGRECKLSKAKDFSLVFTESSFPGQCTGVVAIIGPKRMNYSRNIGLLNSLLHFFEKQ